MIKACILTKVKKDIEIKAKKILFSEGDSKYFVDGSSTNFIEPSFQGDRDLRKVRQAAIKVNRAFKEGIAYYSETDHAVHIEPSSTMVYDFAVGYLAKQEELENRRVQESQVQSKENIQMAEDIQEMYDDHTEMLQTAERNRDEFAKVAGKKDIPESEIVKNELAQDKLPDNLYSSMTNEEKGMYNEFDEHFKNYSYLSAIDKYYIVKGLSEGDISLSCNL